MDLQEPTNQMSKSSDSDTGTVMLSEDLGSVAQTFKRAVTDSDGEVRFDPVAKPGVSNLLSILGACTGIEPAALADDSAPINQRLACPPRLRSTRCEGLEIPP